MHENNRCVILADAIIDRMVCNLLAVKIKTGLHEIIDKLVQIFDYQQGVLAPPTIR